MDRPAVVRMSAVAARSVVVVVVVVVVPVAVCYRRRTVSVTDSAASYLYEKTKSRSPTARRTELRGPNALVGPAQLQKLT